MPEQDPLDDRLAHLARWLDDTVPPVAADDARRRDPAAGPGRRPVRPLVGAAAAAVVVVGLIAVVNRDDNGAVDVIPVDTTTRTTTAPTTTTTTTTVRPLVPPPRFGDLPTRGVVTQEGITAVVHDLDGNILFTSEGALFDRTFVHIVERAAGEPAVESPHGGGVEVLAFESSCDWTISLRGSRYADCEGDLVRLDADGSRTVIVPAPDVPEYIEQRYFKRGNGSGRRYLTASPDETHVLATWFEVVDPGEWTPASEECGSSVAFLIPLDESPPIVVGGVPGAAWWEEPNSDGLGWADDARVLINRRPNPTFISCPREDGPYGIYRIDPQSGMSEMLIPHREFEDGSGGHAAIWEKSFRGGATSSAAERATVRALEELGLEGCCSEPSHGGTQVATGAVYDGAQIAIYGDLTPNMLEHPYSVGTTQRIGFAHGEAAILTPGPAEDTSYGARKLSFTCGSYTFVLGWPADSTPEIDSMLLLAEALMPRLGCTLAEPALG